MMLCRRRWNTMDKKKQKMDRDHNKSSNRSTRHAQTSSGTKVASKAKLHIDPEPSDLVHYE